MSRSDGSAISAARSFVKNCAAPHPRILSWCPPARKRLQLNCRASEGLYAADSPAMREVDEGDLWVNGASENILPGSARIQPSQTANRDGRDCIQVRD